MGCEAEMGAQGSDHGGPCLSREETEYGPTDPSPQLSVSPRSLSGLGAESVELPAQ